jgi:hypothetical protein
MDEVEGFDFLSGSFVANATLKLENGEELSLKLEGNVHTGATLLIQKDNQIIVELAIPKEAMLPTTILNRTFSTLTHPKTGTFLGKDAKALDEAFYALTQKAFTTKPH